MPDIPVSPVTADDPPDPMSWLRTHAQTAPAGHWDELRNRLSALPHTAQPPGVAARSCGSAGRSGCGCDPCRSGGSEGVAAAITR